MFKITVPIAKAAADANFYGKRKRDSKLEVAEDIISVFGLKVDAADLVDALEAARPEKPAKASQGEQKPAMAGQAETRRDTLPVIEGNRFLVVAAQNNTATAPVWDKIKKLALAANAQIVVMPIHYNKNAFSPVCEQSGSFFVNDVKPYLIEQDHWLGEIGGCRLAVDAAVLPTAKLPVNAGANINAGEVLTVIASPKMQYRTLERPAIHGKIRKVATTGTCTEYNYTRSRAGAEAEADHVFGCLFVTVRGGLVWQTQVEADRDGELTFADLSCCIYTTQQSIPEVKALVLGDLHCEKKDQEVWWNTITMVEALGADVIAAHDVLHFSTRSHHNRNDGGHLYRTQWDTVEEDLSKVSADLNVLAECCDTLYLVESNHNSALDNWIHDMGYNPKRDPHNAKVYYWLNWLFCDNDRPDRNMLEIAMSQADNLQVTAHWGRMDCPFMIEGVDLSQHGHKGNNGSQGNPKQLAGWKIPMITGHTHSPSRYGRCVTVGVTGSLDQGYNRGGASSWDHAHAIIWEGGAVQLFNLYATEI